MTENEIRKIQAKKFINVKEFTELYGLSSEWQRNRRNRIHNHLPYRQIQVGGRIMYKVEDNNISR